MTFGGWMGWAEYQADDAGPWLPLLRAAGLLHRGKHTAFGFGQVRLAGWDAGGEVSRGGGA